MSKDYYEILGVGRTATPEEIKSAFRKKAHEYHPDKGGNAEKFKEINEAYQVLGHVEKRKQYDQFGSAFQNGQAGGANWGGFPGGMNFDFGDLGDVFGGFGDIFGFGGQRQTTRRPSRGRDLEMNINLDFLEAAFGSDKDLSFAKNVVCGHCHGNGAEPGAKIETCQACNGSGQVTSIQRTILGSIQTKTICQKCQGEGKTYSQKCSKCHGQGISHESTKLKVRIPAGINDGESIRLGGQGEAGQKGAPAGDLYLHVRVSPHKKFIREGYDIRSEASISVKQAILGDKLDVDTIHGQVKLSIPEGTQSGTTFRLKGKGVTKLHSHGQGDQLVKVVVEIPKNLSKKQKQRLEEMDI